MVKNIWITPAVIDAVGNAEQVLTTCNACLGQYLQDQTNKNGSVDMRSDKFLSDVRAIMREAISTFNPSVGRNLGVSLHWTSQSECNVVVRFKFYSEQPTTYLH